ncbi:MAG: peptidoglycan bridge formation glycyltransferase FemA/FemB family protein [Candidatus Colwellbacteria bacterium]|nr:peptidoglycan bridge formation glycyltransferase FemA/FemB family protein [Candidatus Colwellbacteria bacterium]
MIKISPAEHGQKDAWNNFVKNNYPPIGGFMASWEWGEFQMALGRKIERYLATAEGEIISVFTAVYCRLPSGFVYGYVPRGPALDRGFFDNPEKIKNFFDFLARWIKNNFRRFIFFRLEPPLEPSQSIISRQLIYPDYYIQPRRNLAINLNQSEKEIFSQFHSSTRSNVKKAERKGVTAEIKENLTTSDWNHFFKMAQETVLRNNGKNIYPPREYFETITKVLPPLSQTQTGEMSWRFFCGMHEGQPAAINLVIFFGGTATYLFGASYTKKLPSKVTTYLHWRGLTESKKMGFKYYDLGGIDEKLWPSLTVFKKRFGGEEFEYIGNMDIPVRPLIYRLYNLAQKIRKRVL